MRFLIPIILALLLAACRQSTIEVTTPDATVKSMIKAGEDLDEKDRAEWNKMMVDLQTSLAMSNMFPGGQATAIEALRPLDGMTAQEALAYKHQRDADRAAEKKREETEKAEREKQELAELEQRIANREKALAAVTVRNVQVVDNSIRYRLDFDLTAEVHNGTGKALKRVGFEYSLQSEDRSVPWYEGEGWFMPDGGIEPGETVTANATAGGLSMAGFLSLHKRMKEHPEAHLSVRVTDLTDADDKSLAPNLGPGDQMRLERLREASKKRDHSNS